MDFVSLFVGMIIMAFAYLLVPVILAIRGKEVKVKRVAIINFLVVWLILTVILIELGVEDASAGGLLWAWLGYYILKKRCSPKTNNVQKYSNNLKTSLSEDDEKVDNIPKDEKSDNDIPNKLQQNDAKKSKEKFCSCCGSIIDNETRKCTGCGKQYFNGLKSSKLLRVILISLLVLSFGSNIVFYMQTLDLEEELDWCYQRYEDYEEYFEFWTHNHNKVDFVDENIVFVLEGYGNYFYTYDQVQQVTQGKEYSYWLYHRNNAIKQGYTAWE